VARPRQQHYVTKAYLEGFLKPDQQHLLCYGRGGNRRPFKKSPQELASQRNYYALKKPDGSWDDSIETLLGETVEGPGLPVIRELVSGKTRLSWEERQQISVLIAIQEMRTPAARERVRQLSKQLNERVFHDVKAADPDQKTIDLVGDSGKHSTVSFDEITRSHEDMCDDHAMDIHRPLVSSALKLAGYYQHMKFTVYYGTGDAEFLTTDTPVIRVFHNTEAAPLGTGIQRPDLEIRFPLSRNAFLTLTHDAWLVTNLERARTPAERRRLLATLPEIRIDNAKSSRVTSFNRGHARHAHRWVFASGEVDWAASLLAEPSAAPRIVDLSSRDLFHFQSAVNYDPKVDSGAE
jgi:hypothetical protein